MKKRNFFSSKKVVITSGYFNPLHVGHVSLFRKAKKLGDWLVVVVNNDEQVKAKGSIPFMALAERMKIIKAIRGVDEIFSSIDNDLPIAKSLESVAKKYAGNELIFAKGGDRTSGNIPESEIKVCRAFNIKIVNGVGGGKIQSSSQLLKRIIINI